MLLEPNYYKKLIQARLVQGVGSLIENFMGGMKYPLLFASLVNCIQDE